MTSIDDLFKKPGFPGNKRKLDAARNPDEIYKAAKLSANGDANGSRNHAYAEEEVDDDDVAGPDMPQDDAEDDVDDEEGRFFGGGISKDTVEVLDYLDERDKEEVVEEKFDTAWLRRLALNFERKISKNAELRAKFEDDPPKFMASEADLDADLKALSVLAEHPELYAEFAKLGCVNSLVSLLAHENTDIAIAAIEIIGEMTDEDVQAEPAQWDSLVDALLEADLPSLLVSNLERLDETNEEADRNGVYHSLNLVENLASKPTVSDKMVEESSILEWLLARIQKKESTTSQNKQYAAEVTAILLQSSDKSISKIVAMDAVDLFLQLVSFYRKRDPPEDTNEEEYAENVFDCLTCMTDDRRGKEKLLDAEGIELCLIMLREGKFSKPRALRLLDHAIGGPPAPEVSEKFVDAGGLKVVFGMFGKNQDVSTIEHILGILNSMLAQLPGDSPARIRTLAKFSDRDYKKLRQLVELRQGFAERLQSVDREIDTEKAETSIEDQEAMAEEWASRRLDAGLFSYQTVNVILAWLIAEDRKARNVISQLLKEKQESISDIRATLEEQLVGVQGAEHEAGMMTADTLRTLIEVI